MALKSTEKRQCMGVCPVKRSFMTGNRMRAVSGYLLVFTAVFMAVLSLTCPSEATPEYSARSGEGCLTCHVEGTGGRLTTSGLEFAASGYAWPPVRGYRVLGPMRKSVRFAIGLVHIVTSFLWFGTVLYVHMLLRPAYAEKGLPKGEVRLGIVSMGLVGLTGILLTVSRIRSLDVLYTSQWGIVLSIKIIVYLIMITSAAVMVLFVGPRLKKAHAPADVPADGIYDPDTLSAFNGSEGRIALIAYGHKVYDVTGLKLWKNGRHAKHFAGTDLTEELKKAPHGEEKLEPLHAVGSYDSARRPPKTVYQKIFYFVAYMNLVLVYVVLITIAYWRWGL